MNGLPPATTGTTEKGESVRKEQLALETGLVEDGQKERKKRLILGGKFDLLLGKNRMQLLDQEVEILWGYRIISRRM